MSRKGRSLTASTSSITGPVKEVTRRIDGASDTADRPATESPAGAIPEVAHGVLQRIDLIDRAVTIDQEEHALTFAIPPACEVLLNGERVKLRMLQPRDRVRVAYRCLEGGRAALSVEARTRS